MLLLVPDILYISTHSVGHFPRRCEALFARPDPDVSVTGLVVLSRPLRADGDVRELD